MRYFATPSSSSSSSSSADQTLEPFLSARESIIVGGVFIFCLAWGSSAWVFHLSLGVWGRGARGEFFIIFYISY